MSRECQPGQDLVFYNVVDCDEFDMIDEDCTITYWYNVCDIEGTLECERKEPWSEVQDCREELSDAYMWAEVMQEDYWYYDQALWQFFTDKHGMSEWRDFEYPDVEDAGQTWAGWIGDDYNSNWD